MYHLANQFSRKHHKKNEIKTVTNFKNIPTSLINNKNSNTHIDFGVGMYENECPDYDIKKYVGESSYSLNKRI